MPPPPEQNVEIRMTGQRARKGVHLVDFEKFVDSFVRALRDFDRFQRQEPTKKSGHPTKRTESVSAFRLTAFRTGSGVATLEPIIDESNGAPLIDSDPRLPVLTLRALLAYVDDGRTTDPAVVEALDDARRAFGDDGALEITMPAVAGGRTTTIDAEATARLRRSRSDADVEVSRVTGLLHLVDIDPDRIGVRSASGIEWSCHYDESLELRIRDLIGQLVVVSGSGRLMSGVRGTMEISTIEPALTGEQTEFFSEEPRTMTELLGEQHVTAPQTLRGIGDPQWRDDEESEAYLAAIFGTG